MNKLSEAIEQAKQECLTFGNADIRIDDQITIGADWEESEQDDNCDVVTIYVYEENIIKIRYELIETRIERY